uniref:Adenosylmethionine decarboxylase n=1 Tax=Grammatophora oceanica TaxID=210454 RepID=A0A7S1Y593_9STRA|mmetsp:Transcript_29881/g.44128  ORF Transcript_29881/g.44128 Transcript_29881/m.44128 type:complete len:305 (+) Transcript_29881:342-1256(+)|eukprot:CAMPEP_0194049116 /NCGR_PEP_ID=MMETSP0009_2-20130614/29702_1 /TAXON_ID=210454 /ORGANISM="Grammatophora oceanica, Strain CCMP 410" /LENGTH=304 /DNA_ID=CAMNT_0038695189 /DNA_START=241 /DNA_END=1155 /DNA_ORIENTATION=+
MSDLSGYEVDYIEIIGYVGGVVLAVALVPQVIKSWKEKSTADISYSWQVIYIVGLWLNFAYFILVDAVAAWVTLLFEIVCAHLLVLLKLRFDGCSTRSRGHKNSTDMDGEDKTESSDSETHSCRTSIDPSIMMSGSKHNITKTMTVAETFCFGKRASVDKGELVSNAYRGFHFTIDIRFDDPVNPAELGDEVMKEMLSAAKRHGVRSVGELLQVFDGTVSPPGFASAVLLDESHMTAHCYSDEGMLAFDCFTCGSNPEGTRRVTLDMVKFFKARLGAGTKVDLGHMPRFPEKQLKSKYEVVSEP